MVLSAIVSVNTRKTGSTFGSTQFAHILIDPESNTPEN